MDTPVTLLVETRLPAAVRGDREAFVRIVDGTRGRCGFLTRWQPCRAASIRS